MEIPWLKHQQWERKWHDTCINSYQEETKQIVYARKMGLELEGFIGKYPIIDLEGKSVIDIGGGPYSLLLKTINGGRKLVVDPCAYPKWVYSRYKKAQIEFKKVKAEDYGTDLADEVWIYNCLQHTENPELILKNAREMGKIIRIFEWVNTEHTMGHPQVLNENQINEWLGGIGKAEDINESGCYGRCYYGIFRGNHYQDYPQKA